MKVRSSDLLEIAEEAGLSEESVRFKYSGRQMYGDHCVGFTIEQPSDMLSLGGAILTVLGSDYGSDFIRGARIDNLGRNTIVYFTGVIVSDVVGYLITKY